MVLIYHFLNLIGVVLVSICLLLNIFRLGYLNYWIILLGGRRIWILDRNISDNNIVAFTVSIGYFKYLIEPLINHWLGVGVTFLNEYFLAFWELSPLA